MSWTTPPLLRGLLDDAAVFPPAATPLPDAVRDHGGHRSSWYAGCVGPLLVPAASVAELVAVLLTDEKSRTRRCRARRARRRARLPRRRPTPPSSRPGLHVLRDEVGIHVVGVELGWEHGWRDLGLDDVAVVLEVPRGPDQAVAVADVRTAVGEGRPVIAKFRTGATPTWEWPDATELGAFLLLVGRSRGAVQAHWGPPPRGPRDLRRGGRGRGEPRRAQRPARHRGRPRGRRAGGDRGGARG